jgi:hypothetical protein
MTYKNEYGSFPPANMGPTDVSTPQRATATALWVGAAVNTNHPAYKHLVRIFPRLNELASGVNSPYYAMSQMSPAQALVFWLYGFYEDPEHPLTNNGVPGSRKKLFDFDESRLYAASPYLFNGTPQQFASRGSQAAASYSPYPVYFTGHPSCGLPYVYFDARCYSTAPIGGVNYDINYAAANLDGTPSIASPYINSLPPVNGTWGQHHMAGETFQIIAAGKDGLYGGSSRNQAAFPTPTTYPLPWKEPNNGPTTTYTFWSSKDAIGGQGHSDNLTNFSDRALGDAVESLQ